MNITELTIVASTLGTFTFLAAFLGSFLGSFMRERKKLLVELIQNKESGEIETLVTEESGKGGKVEFLDDPTEQDLQDMNKPLMSKFINSFKIKK